MKSLIALALVACGGGDGSVDAQDDDGRTSVADLPAAPDRALDVLFIVDDSSAMAQKQETLGASMQAFVDRLAAGPSGLPDLHVGVVTTDMGTRFGDAAQPAPGIGTLGAGGCANRGNDGALTISGAAVTDRFLVDVALPDGTRQRNYAGDLAAVLGDMVRVGAGGCGFEQPLAAMRAALENPANTRFLRSQAKLAIVFVSDEDDCSAKSAQLFAPESAQLGALQSFRCTRFGVTCDVGGTTSDQMNVVGVKDSCRANPASAIVEDIAPYVTFLKELKPFRDVTVALIAGTLNPIRVELRDLNGTQQPALASSCAFESATGRNVADPPVRLEAFVREFPNRGTSRSICENDLQQSVASIGDLITTTLGTPCLDTTPLDVDPNTPGLQGDCVAADVVGATVTQLPACDAGSPPCWKIEPDAACPLTNLRLVVTRASEPPAGTRTTLRCRVR